MIRYKVKGLSQQNSVSVGRCREIYFTYTASIPLLQAVWTGVV